MLPARNNGTEHTGSRIRVAVTGNVFFFFSSRRRHTRCSRDWSSDVCSSDLAQAEAQILSEILNPIYSAGVAAFLFGLLDTAQVDSRAPVRLFLRHPFCYVFVGFSFEVVAQLVIQFLVRLRPAKQRPQPQWNREQPMLRSHSPALLHSYLRAAIGSTLVARRAGTSVAISPNNPSTATANTMGTGSSGLSP